jgi:hypothetical protein
LEIFAEQRHKHPENDTFLTMLSAANDSSQEGISINQLLILESDNCTSKEKLEMHLNKIMDMDILSYDESTKRYKITKRGLYYLRFYAVTGMDIFE